MAEIRMITMENPLYQAERVLRNRVLLRPVGLPDYAWEMHDRGAWHFVALEDNAVTGCVVLNPLDKELTRAQLMQMAVEEAQQGKGTGRQLVNALLQFCAAGNIREVTCHARDTAVPFYEKLGFEIYGESFTEVGLLHRHMRIYID